jgi:hypothetical protein
MHAIEATAAQANGLDINRLERTLRVSIKLMKRSQRELQRLRPQQQAETEDGHRTQSLAATTA